MNKRAPLITVIDYGMGNIRSVSKALELLGAKVLVTDRPRKILESDASVFPGVGSFGHAIKYLRKSKLDTTITSFIEKKKPFLGLCLGFQLLFDYSDEEGGHKGLGIIPGEVKRFCFKSSKFKIPHMGWNIVKPENRIGKTKMFRDIGRDSFFYFVHSYYGEPKMKESIAATTDYGFNFCSAIARDNIWACQFHPEKSSTFGLKLLKNFVSEASKC
ncbi:MAG: imidazole glycerol phosphate synthase subunit HisH [Endomicrobiales bacterium]|nr:imidazole glycerol phosphate synthase subunit HisH [Endomicrobiales bacterium]